MVENENEINELFFYFYDSLKLSSQLYPDLLEFTRYREYKPAVIALLATLVDSGYVKPELYSKNKTFLLIEANEELKRKLAAEEKNKFSEPGESDQANVYAISNFYRSTYVDNGFIEKDILNYYSTLLYGYIADPKVEKYFKKINRIENKDVLLNNYLLLLKHNKEVPDSIWNNYSKSNTYRITLYENLSKLKHLEKFNKKYLTTEYYLRSKLYISSDESTDSVKLITVREIKWKNKKGYVYLFKRTNEDAGFASIDCIGIVPIDSSKFNYTIIDLNKEQRLYEDQKEDEIIESQLKNIIYADRLRYISRSRYNNSYYDEGLYDEGY